MSIPAILREGLDTVVGGASCEAFYCGAGGIQAM